MGCHGMFTQLYKKMKEKMGINDDDDDDDPNIRCTFCTRKERLKYLDNLKPGDHICMGGQNLMKNLGVYQRTIYTHHAIVKYVAKMDSANYAVTLIHFYSTAFDDAIKIKETTEVINLGYYDIHKICYTHKTHHPEKIIERAESLTKLDTTYNLVSCNCEHFCHWCCIGSEDSYQVTNVLATLRYIASGAVNIAGKAMKVIARFLMISLDDVAKGARAYIAVPWGILGIMALVYLVYCIYRHIKLNKDLSGGKICARCCGREKADLWLKFFIYCSTQAGGIGLISLVMASGVCGGVVIGCIALISTLTILLMWGIPKLKNALSSPFKGRLVTVNKTRDILIADVISFKYKGKMHDGIVSRIQKISNTKATLTLIHYSRPGMFQRGMVEEEKFTFDLTTDVINSHDFTGYTEHPPEIVLQRARQRLGETKFGMLSNRSCHFCHWAKVMDDQDEPPSDDSSPTTLYEREIKLGEDISGLKQLNVDHSRKKKHSTKPIGFTWARIPQDIKAGEVVYFKHGLLHIGHYAITTAVHHTDEPSSRLSVTAIHYGQNKKLCEEILDFDLRYQDIWIYKYHPIHRFSRDDVIRRARAQIGIGTHKRSWKFVQEVVQKNEDQRISNFEEIDPGDVIIFYYWSLKHAAVVTMIGTSDAKANNRAFVTIVHYALDSLLATRTVKQDTVLMDLKRDTVYKRNYDGFVTYPLNIVIRRAWSRLGEQRFSAIGNTSWDLVHWAKVIQNPSMVTKTNVDMDIPVAETKEKMVLLPKTGKVYEKFQRVPVHAWRDLQPGIIIEYSYYMIWHQGILSDVNFKAKKVSVIHYGTNTIFSTRTIMEDTFRVNLGHDELWVYRCDPNFCNPPELIVAKARERLGEQKWGSKNKSWHFCKECVLRQRRNSE